MNPDAGSIVVPHVKEEGAGDSDDIFAYMGQDPIFFEGTLRDNLTMLANENVDDEEILDGPISDGPQISRTARFAPQVLATAAVVAAAS